MTKRTKAAGHLFLCRESVTGKIKSVNSDKDEKGGKKQKTFPFLINSEEQTRGSRGLQNSKRDIHHVSDAAPEKWNLANARELHFP